MPKQTSGQKRGTGSGNRYESLGLRRNPFAGQILPSDRPSIPPYQPIKQKIEGFITAFLENRASRGMVFLGDYGTGKTYHLKWMKSQFDQREETNVHTIYLETPGLEPYDLVRGILSEIGEEQVAKGVWNILRPLIIAEIKEMGQQDYLRQFAIPIEAKGKKSSLRVHDASQREMLFTLDYGSLSDEDLRDHRTFLRSFDKTGYLSRERLRDHYQRKLHGPRAPAITNNVAVARELASICFFSGSPALASWEKLVIQGPGGTTAFPPQGEPGFLQAIVKVLNGSGVEYLVLFVDEFEKVPLLQTMTEREARRYLDTVRMLIDRSWNELPFAWVLAANEDAWGWIEKENRALVSRVTRVTLPRTDAPDLARYLLEEFVKPVWLEEHPGEPLFPFPDNILDLIPLALRKTPRDLVRLCDAIVEAAADKRGVKPPLPTSLVADIIKEATL